MSFRFDLVDIRLFVAIASCHNLTKAADAIHISAPAASVRLKNLEAALGTKLCIREPTGITLTPSGKQFQTLADELLRQARSIETQMRAYIDGEKGDLKVLMSPTVLSGFCPFMINRFLVENPDVNLEMEEHLSDEIVDAITHSQADFGVVSDTVYLGKLNTIPYKTEKLVVIASDRHVIAKRDGVRMSDLYEFDFVSLSKTSAITAYIHKMTTRSNAVLKNRVAVGSFDSVANLVRGNIGLAILPESLTETYRTRYGLQVIRLDEDWATRQLVICHRGQDTLTTYAKNFIALLLDSAPEAGLVL